MAQDRSLTEVTDPSLQILNVPLAENLVLSHNSAC